MNKDFFKILDYDTKLFGYKVANYFFDENNTKKDLDNLKSKKIKLLYSFLDPASKKNLFAKKNNFLLVDEKITYKLNLEGFLFKKNKDLKSISLKNKKITPELIELVLESGIYSRFKIDNGFTKGEYEKLYRDWLKKSVETDLCFEVLGLVKNNELIGFITLSEENLETANIGLIAISKKYQGKGFGNKLINFGIEKMKNLGYKNVLVSTQKQNVNACLFYEKNGFKKSKIINVYHYWL